MNRITLGIQDVSNILMIPDKQDFANTWETVVTSGFIFDKFTLIIPEMTQLFKVEITGYMSEQVIYIKKIQKDNYGHTTVVHHYDINVLDYLTKMNTYMIAHNTTKNLFDLYTQADKSFIDIVIPMSFIQYVMTEGRKRPVEYIESKPRQNNKKRSYSSSNKNTEYKLLDCIKVYAKQNRSGKHEFHVSEFPRRGYFRHLKSGKVVFVKPTTVRPKNSENKENFGTDYTL